MVTRRFMYILSVCIVLALLGMWWRPLLWSANVVFAVLVVAGVCDMLFTVQVARRVHARRTVGEHFSLSQSNAVSVDITMEVSSRVRRMVRIESYDTVPVSMTVLGCAYLTGEGVMTYHVMPTTRGRYEFGAVRSFVRTRVPGLVEWRRFQCQGEMVKVYPTFRRLERLESELNIREMIGQQRLRKAGNSTDFDRIRAYIPGDDVRTVNWRATARAAALMVNTYTDERSRQIIPVVCAGPSMLVTNEGVTLLDRATSAAVALASAAVRHYDEAGLITVSHEGVQTYMKPERSTSTIGRILERTYSFGLPPTPSEMPYADDPDVVPDDIDAHELAALLGRMRSTMADPDYDALATYVLTKIKRRSLLVLFANFENLSVAQAVAPALVRIASRHNLMVVLFRDEDIESVVKARAHTGPTADTISEQRLRTLCTEYLTRQQELAAYLRSQHIDVVFTSPGRLSLDVLQRYLDLKNRNAI